MEIINKTQTEFFAAGTCPTCKSFPFLRTGVVEGTQFVTANLFCTNEACKSIGMPRIDTDLAKATEGAVENWNAWFSKDTDNNDQSIAQDP